ncbi:nitrite reductase small subunit NirD [Flammeovirgaceae bacterium SG7u.111]|nr:nitrite reductase small subunit NirD [Flammeovirgaceae bacterium SG7u.132]WPO33419.1 nitrite reductase small subunit NirD [Flammeovirgaceae bacterium SG7u.111]
MIDFAKYKTTSEENVKIWLKAAPVDSFPKDGGSCVLYKGLQIAVFNFTRRGEWFACQNLCPHKMQMILSRGMIGSSADEPKVACPYHKKTFSLKSGECMSGEDYSIATYPVKVEDGYVYVGFEE